MCQDYPLVNVYYNNVYQLGKVKFIIVTPSTLPSQLTPIPLMTHEPIIVPHVVSHSCSSTMPSTTPPSSNMVPRFDF